MPKVYVQIIDSRTGSYQFEMIDEPVTEGNEVSNALMHLGVTFGHVKWSNENVGIVEGTTKIVCVIVVK